MTVAVAALATANLILIIITIGAVVDRHNSRKAVRAMHSRVAAEQAAHSDTQAQLNAARSKIEDLEFNSHLADSDLRIERRSKQEAQQLAEIHRMQGYAAADAASTVAMLQQTRPTMPQHKRGEVVDLWTKQTQVSR